ncbi:response regulator [Streptomyces acidicola]
MASAPGTRDGRVRVLNVHDEPGLTGLLSAAVTEAGWRPYPAPDGESALRVARGWAPHVVVLGGMLPDLDGLQVLRRLRYEHPKLPVLMLTPATRWSTRIDGLSAGADDYVTRPFSLEEVVLRLRGLLRRVGVEEAPRDESVCVLEDLVPTEETRPWTRYRHRPTGTAWSQEAEGETPTRTLTHPDASPPTPARGPGTSAGP